MPSGWDDSAGVGALTTDELLSDSEGGNAPRSPPYPGGRAHLMGGSRKRGSVGRCRPSLWRSFREPGCWADRRGQLVATSRRLGLAGSVRRRTLRQFAGRSRFTVARPAVDPLDRDRLVRPDRRGSRADSAPGPVVPVRSLLPPRRGDFQWARIFPARAIWGSAADSAGSMSR
jgi:hypothetical protein